MEAKSMYMPAPELNGLVRKVINDYHPYLTDAKIHCLFRTGRWKVKDATQLGKAVVAPPVWKCITGYELLLVINKSVFDSLSEAGQTALIDHVISFFKEPQYDANGNLLYGTRDHDVKEFSAVVKRHNICFSNLRAIEADGSRQLSLFNPLATEVVNEEALKDIQQPKESEELICKIEEFDEDEAEDDDDSTVLQSFSFGEKDKS